MERRGDIYDQQEAGQGARAEAAEDRRVGALAAAEQRDREVIEGASVDDGRDTHDPAEDRFWREEQERREESLDPDRP